MEMAIISYQHKHEDVPNTPSCCLTCIGKAVLFDNKFSLFYKYPTGVSVDGDDVDTLTGYGDGCARLGRERCTDEAAGNGIYLDGLSCRMVDVDAVVACFHI